ncbi:class I SAM-dependent methyltransferase [Amycolatopsis carbonis]|uniref:Class I SAM-dependent methyltransferase n=1 Tax=Amycolatopsis carbonis TaxID=715471 RepID=A0A9Y2MW77_9PSEU|nr:class I SAM-dependent methyltransferase [Amycolatopsis sp. 2-15]WIX79493.1 class I SAM-dependent methyltransferase [Amycolatopsis sp. 2-15]
MSAGSRFVGSVPVGLRVLNEVVSAHTHDHIDWADRLTQLRTADTLDSDALSAIARRLVAALPPTPTIVDLGCGAGGMSTHFARGLATHGGGTLVLVDATPELLAEAEKSVRAAVDTASNAADAVAGQATRGAVGGAGSTGSRSGSDDRADGGSANAAFDTSAVDAPATRARVGGAGSVGRRPTSSDRAEGGSTSSATGVVEVRVVRGDLADAGLPGVLPAADLVWASRVVHHLPDQQEAVGTVAAVAKAGGLVALAEGGLDFRCLPWDLGVGRPGLEDRLLAAQAEWFIGMREGIEGAVAMPYGWSTALERAGLTDVDSFGALVHHRAPGPAMLAEYVVHRVARIFEFGGEYLTPDDRETLTSLLDPDGPYNLAARRDLYLTGAKIVHCGRRS